MQRRWCALLDPRPVTRVRERQRLTTKFPQVYIDYSRSENGRKRTRYQVATEYESRWIVNVSPAHCRKGRSVMELPIFFAKWKAEELSFLLVLIYRHMRVSSPLKVLRVETFASRWRRGKFASLLS